MPKADRKAQFRDRLEGWGARFAMGIFRLLPLDMASALGGWIGRTIGPRAGISRRAADNLRRAFPDISDAETDRIIRDMWDHLGRVIGEFPHAEKFQCYDDKNTRIEVVGAEYIDMARDDDMTGIFFSGHIGNWELSALAVSQRGLRVAEIYRAPNNPFVEDLIQELRGSVVGEQFAKGTRGARQMLRAMGQGGHIAILIDQKMNDGIAVPFFDHPAMTAPASAQLALRFRCPLIPVRCERLTGANFRITAFPPLDLPDSGDSEQDIVTLMQRSNRCLEDWIRDKPEQWLWLHNRWPD